MQEYRQKTRETPTKEAPLPKDLQAPEFKAPEVKEAEPERALKKRSRYDGMYCTCGEPYPVCTIGPFHRR